jgi:hypothetical protein
MYIHLVLNIIHSNTQKMKPSMDATFLYTLYGRAIVMRAAPCNAFATSMDPDQPALPRSLFMIHVVRLQTLLQVVILLADSKDPDQTERMRSQTHNVIHVGR